VSHARVSRTIAAIAAIAGAREDGEMRTAVLSLTSVTPVHGGDSPREEKRREGKGWEGKGREEKRRERKGREGVVVVLLTRAAHGHTLQQS